MKTPRSDLVSRWEKLVRQAQADNGPPTNLPVLLAAVRRIPFARREDLLTELAAAFAGGRAIPVCLVGTGVITILTTWQISTVWEALPWAEFVITTGGAP